MKRSALTFFAFASLVGSSAWADLVPVSQTRSVGGSASAQDDLNSDFDSDFDAATDFGPFQSGAAATATVPNAEGQGGGTQDSSISSTGIEAFGTCFAVAESYDFDGFSDGGGTSLMSVTFDLTANKTYTLTGSISAFDNGSAYLSLRDSGGEIFETFAFGPSEIVSINESGELPAGQYTLEIDIDGDAFGDSFNSDYGSGEYTVSFQVAGVPKVPAAGDLAWLGAVLTLALAGVLLLRR